VTGTIISASLNADIPARYARWFMGRVEAGYCTLPRRDGLQHRRVDLAPHAVAGFVFWTRRLEPFMGELDELRRRGYGFTIQFALTGYPRDIDPSPLAVEAALDELHLAAQRFGPRAVVWRYDPIVITPTLTTEWHVENFHHLARGVCGATDEVILAFASSGCRRGGGHADSAVGVPHRRRFLVATLAPIARGSGLRLCVCSDVEALAPGAAPARCIDADRLADSTGHCDAVPTGGIRPGCLCARAVDIGDRVGSSPHLFCGALSRRRTWPQRGPADEMLYPQRTRFAQPSDDELPF